jgi:hypothetical protein
VAPALIVHLGWRSIFLIYGAVGFLWFALWCFVGADRPHRHRWISEAERDWICEHRRPSRSAVDYRAESIPLTERSSSTAIATTERHSADKDASTEAAAESRSNEESAQEGDARDADVPWRAFFTTSACYALYAAHFANNWGLYFFISWHAPILSAPICAVRGVCVRCG